MPMQYDQLPGAIAAAASGGMVGAMLSSGGFLERAAVFAAGTLVAFWLGPVVGPFFHAMLEAADKAFLGDAVKINEAAAYSAAGFLLGVTGMTIVASIKRVIEAARKRAERAIGKA